MDDLTQEDRLGTNVKNTHRSVCHLAAGREGPLVGCLRFKRCGKRHFLRHLYIKTNILPRQARDKHRENSKKSGVFLRSGACRKEKSVSLPTFPLCLSRACLGKMIGFHHKMGQKRHVFAPGHRGASTCSPHRQHQADTSAAMPLCGSGSAARRAVDRFIGTDS